MNILQLCLSEGLGGLELYVWRCSIALQGKQNNNSNNKHKVLAVLNKNSKLDNHFDNNKSIQYQYLNPCSKSLPLLNAFKLAKIIDKNKIDIIHLHWGNDLPLAAIAKIFSKQKPALLYTRQMGVTRLKDDVYHNLLYGQLNLMLTITKQIETVCKKLIPRHKEKIKKLYYGVSQPQQFLNDEQILHQREALGFKKDDFIIALIGRLEPVKGQHLLIKAMHIAKQNGQQLNVLIVGHEMDQGYRDKLKQQAESLGVLNNIIFKDFSSEPQQLMQLCDCLVLATKNEAFGLVLPEAMRAGIAVIGSNSGGVPEIIEHQKTGLLFESGDETSLYQQIKTYYENSESKENIAIKGKEKADNIFNDDKHFQTLEHYMMDLVEQYN
jgi:glycosyltransferase involved in cell wall biosynthesis